MTLVFTFNVHFFSKDLLDVVICFSSFFLTQTVLSLGQDFLTIFRLKKEKKNTPYRPIVIRTQMLSPYLLVEGTRDSC